ncbi:carboxypeptidase-like regulatory domain-containing protein [Hymenobacter weizhouensis]|uniref:carboxypeptidase-like regulatory domain-containing protein n=1 Tax=Hymenobacter sp. YIM 151500-1 TaxID=2987689 RepID=UPI002226771C|nr:carboxypeptidase-like regulatory domain-containing protein [Hymenobacter sp. YIM 151500-1]UYZ63439.1 carboxypeptidase-like regulatory domain-containing protein [Hymenobacter sp. YIM 151500-1]
MTFSASSFSGRWWLGRRALAVLVLLLGLAHLGRAQVQLRGTVRDKETREVLPFATVAVPGSGNGTTTNLEGEFTLTVASLPVTLLVSELGHVRDTIRVTSASEPLALALAPATVVLPEVKVGSYPFQLVDRAFRHLQRNYRRQYFGKAFYRQITRISNEPTELQEVVWNVKSNPARMEGTTLAQGRYAGRPAITNFSNFSLYTRSFGLYDPRQDSTKSLALLSPNVEKNYLLELVGIVGQDSTGGVAEIKFETRPELTKYRAEGTVWIDINTYQVVRYRMSTPNFTATTNNPSQQYRNPRLNIEMDFQDGEAAVAPLELMKVDLTAELTQPGKPATPISVSSFTFFYDQGTTPTGLPYARVSVDDRDLDAIRAKPYDPEFWANNPVVKRTPAEDEVIAAFEKKGAFGTMVKKPAPKPGARR